MAITYPTLTEQNSSRDFIETFGGYNHNLRIGEGEFYDMKNLTSSYYPLLSTRQPRGTAVNYTFDVGSLSFNLFPPVAMVDNDGLNTLLCSSAATEDGNYALFLLREEALYFVGYTATDYKTNRNMVSMGANVIVFPEKIYFNVTELDGKGFEVFPNSFEEAESKCISKEMEATFESENITFSLCKADGTDYVIKDENKCAEEPADAKNGDLWLDTSVTPPSLKIYSGANDMWTSIATTYIKISVDCTVFDDNGDAVFDEDGNHVIDEEKNIGGKFEVYDGVRISGVANEDLLDLNNTMVIQAKGFDVKEYGDGSGTYIQSYIVVIGYMGSAGAYGNNGMPIKLERIVPDMDFVIESNNRLWGCRYGKNRDDAFVNEIYASKLGDFKSWECFHGTSIDSYVASVGSDGAFTGAISYLGYPLFFKQNCLYTVYGSYPATYQIQLTECRGVQQGCHNSLVVIDGTLYYKALGGVCAYNGSLPVEIGSALGEIGKRYYGANAGAYRHKYYIGMRDANAESSKTWLFVYDTEKGMWHKEDQYGGDEFCYCSSEDVDQLYYLAYGKVKTIIGEADMTDDEKNISWFAETGILGCSSPDKKYISKISIRFSVDIGTRIRVFAEYDSSGVWEQLAVFTGSRLGAFTLPFKPRRCDHLRLKIEGNGAAKIYSISKTMEDGGEV